MEDVVIVSDAQSASNEVGICPDVGAECRTDDVVTTPKEIPLTQNHPSVIVTCFLFLFTLYSIPLSQCHPYLWFKCRRHCKLCWCSSYVSIIQYRMGF